MKTVEGWPRCTQAAAFFERQLRAFLDVNPRLQELAHDCSSVAGVNLANLVDHLVLPESTQTLDELCKCGLERAAIASMVITISPFPCKSFGKKGEVDAFLC